MRSGGVSSLPGKVCPLDTIALTASLFSCASFGSQSTAGHKVIGFGGQVEFKMNPHGTEVR